MKKLLLFISLISLPLLSGSCSNEPDLSDSRIEYYRYANPTHDTETLIENESIRVAIGKPVYLQIRTQSNDGSTPRFFGQVDDQQKAELIGGEIPVVATYTHDDGSYRQINELEVFLLPDLYSPGQVISFETRIGSKSGVLSEKIYLVLE